MSAAVTPSWCTIHLNRISSNLELALARVPRGRSFCAVLKADAYGHGIEHVVPLISEQGVNLVGITSNAEAYAVRRAGFDGRLIRLRTATAEEIEDAFELHVEEQVASLDAALRIKLYLETGQMKTPLHLSLNAAGMARDALEISHKPGQETCCSILETLGNSIEGICSHFPSNEPGALPQNASLFNQHVAWVIENSDLKRSDVLVHAGSSLTLVSETDVDTDMYRCGAILYGIL